MKILSSLLTIGVFAGISVLLLSNNAGATPLDCKDPSLNGIRSSDSDRICIDATLRERHPTSNERLPEFARFSGIFPKVAGLRSGRVLLTQSGNPDVVSDQVLLEVRELDQNLINVVLSFISDPTNLDSPELEGEARFPPAVREILGRKPETREFQSINRDFLGEDGKLLFGAKLPFEAFVQSDVEEDQGIPSDRIIFNAILGEEARERARFFGFFPNDNNLLSGTVFLTEPGSPEENSDSVSLRVSNNDPRQNLMKVLLTFASDPTGPDHNRNSLGRIRETGKLQSINEDFLGEDGKPLFGAKLPFEVFVQSDVPEPSTFLLLSSGMAGLVVLGRRRFLRNSQ